LLDRIDLRVAVPALSSEELLDENSPSDIRITSAQAAAQVRAARELQLGRAGKLNSELAGDEMRKYCALDRQSRRLLGQARTSLGLSARGVHRVLRVARTIADLGGADALGVAHLAEALQMRRKLD
jgi:magnesium chelatase family protein